MKYTGLKNNYIDVEGSFGGNQEWLKEEGRPWKGRAISGYGCGLIGASDLLLHVLGRDIISQGAVEKRSENEKESTSGSADISLIERENYIRFIQFMERRYFHIFPKLGLSGILLALGLNLYFLIHRKMIKQQSGCTYHARWAVWPSRMLDTIKSMLDDDIPVILSIGPGFFRKNKLKFYRKNKNASGEDTYKAVTETKDHYVTVTGVIEAKLQDKNDITLLEISSWGKKYYVNYSEYQAFVRKNDNYYFSNILYIKKKPLS
ncbi:hypothetical protein SAMN06297422_1264 [Lachnospiraceae bacterium]|nr:hypothetical protein SAMN06297422_1264 [Lachnospiraceae bacterium]